MIVSFQFSFSYYGCMIWLNDPWTNRLEKGTMVNTKLLPLCPGSPFSPWGLLWPLSPRFQASPEKNFRVTCAVKTNVFIANTNASIDSNKMVQTFVRWVYACKKKLSPGLLFLPSIWQTSNIFWLRSDSCLMHSIINFDHHLMKNEVRVVHS